MTDDDKKTANYQAIAGDLRDMAKRISLKQDQAALLQSAAEWDRLANSENGGGGDSGEP